jgi:hypothetical protein
MHTPMFWVKHYYQCNKRLGWDTGGFARSRLGSVGLLGFLTGQGYAINSGDNKQSTTSREYRMNCFNVGTLRVLQWAHLQAETHKFVHSPLQHTDQ